jgi:pentatricopeptide repeat protein
MNVSPNLRTMNALLRGCLNLGDVDISRNVFESMKIHKIQPDYFSFHYLIQCLCHTDNIKEAIENVEKMDVLNSNYGVKSPGYLAVAKSCALHGDAKNSEKFLHKTEAAIKKEKNSIQNDRNNIFFKFQNEEAEKDCQEIKKFLKTFDQPETHKFTDSPNVIFAKDKKIKFKKIFDLKNPMYLEICSGAGDWIIEKAKSDKKINWTALEMRNDRNYSIFSKMVFENVKNVAIVQGEALKTLKECFKKNSIDKVFSLTNYLKLIFQSTFQIHQFGKIPSKF